MIVPRPVAITAFLLLLAGPCLAQTGQSEGAAASPSGVGTVPLALPLRLYIERALDLMERSSLHRTTVDWPKFRAETLADAVGSRSPEDLHAVLARAIRRMGDTHGVVLPIASSAALLGTSSSASNAPVTDAPLHVSSRPVGMLARARVGYLWVPGVRGGSNTAATVEYATLLQGAIARLDGQRVCGWIVDLRDNTGGNMWPMIAGIGPLLGEGTAGYFLTASGLLGSWGYAGGASLNGETPQTRVTGTPYRMREPNAPVAVLTGPRTASSGEAMVVAFRGRPNTRSFGGATNGLSTANQGFTMPDGATLLIATASYVDRTGQRYGGVIEPDVLVEPGLVSGRSTWDDAARAAADWVRAQSACMQ